MSLCDISKKWVLFLALGLVLGGGHQAFASDGDEVTAFANSAYLTSASAHQYTSKIYIAASKIMESETDADLQAAKSEAIYLINESVEVVELAEKAVSVLDVAISMEEDEDLRAYYQKATERLRDSHDALIKAREHVNLLLDGIEAAEEEELTPNMRRGLDPELFHRL